MMKKISMAMVAVLSMAAVFAADRQTFVEGDATYTVRDQPGVAGYDVVYKPSNVETGTAYLRVDGDLTAFSISTLGTSYSHASDYVVGYYTYGGAPNQVLSENEMMRYARASDAAGQVQSVNATALDPEAHNTLKAYQASEGKYQVDASAEDAKVGFYLRHADGTYQVASHFERTADGMLALYFDAARSGRGCGAVVHGEEYIIFGEIIETKTSGTPLPGFLPTLLLGALGLGGFKFRRG